MVTKLMELYQKYKEIILYVFFGGLATVVSIGSFAWCDVIMHMDPLIANLISWVLAVTFAYTPTVCGCLTRNLTESENCSARLPAFSAGEC